MDRARPLWQTILLHLLLIGSSVVFALPFVWLVGTSWKLDKEVQSEKVELLPARPVPRDKSPYIDPTTTMLERPEDIGRHRWDEWMSKALTEEIGGIADAWKDDRAVELPREDVHAALVAGVFKRLRATLPPDTWRADEAAFRSAVRAAVKPEYLNDAFATAYRYLGIGKILMKDQQYRIHDLTGKTPADKLWKVESGPVTIESRIEAEEHIAALKYDWASATANEFEISAILPMPVPFAEFKRLDVSFRRDETWHELRAIIEVAGRQFRSAEPKYLGEDAWWEMLFQLPSADDDRMMPKHYVLLEQTGSGPQFDHGDGKMKLRIVVRRSSKPEAYWAKGTENYRKVFEEVPFWRYLATSVFLAIANIAGTGLSCAMVAYALARLNWPGRELSFVMVLATLMIPPQVTMIPSFIIYKYLGWYNSLAPLWVPSCLATNAFAVFLLRQAMKGIPKELEDAAKIDGCGYWRTFWHVVWPDMRPTLAAIGIFTFMYVWNDFMGPLIYVNDQRLYPLALGLFSFMAGRENQFTLIMAGAVIMTLPVVIIFFTAQRYFIQGVTLSGLKG